MSQSSSDDVEAIRADVEATRSRVAADVAELEHKADPSRVRRDASERVKSEARGRLRRVKETVMGASDSAGDARDAVREGPEAARRQARGNPLGAGLVAFGAGMVVASLIPASEDEERAAARLRARFEEPAKQHAKDAAQSVREDVEPEARRATKRVQQQAKSGAERTKGEAQGRAENVRGKAQDAQQSVRSSG